MSQQPEIVFRHGQCSAAIFANSYTRGEHQFTTRTVAFQRRFKDKSGKWQSTGTLSVNDIPKAVLVLNKAYEYLTSGNVEQEEQTDHQTEEQAPPHTGPQESPPSPGNGRTQNSREANIAEQQKRAIVNLCKQMGISEERIGPLLRQRYNVLLDELDAKQRSGIIQKLQQEVRKLSA